MTKPKRSMRIAVRMKKMWSLSIHWMMKVSSQKQVSAVHTEMAANLTQSWPTGEKSEVKPCWERARSTFYILFAFCNIPSDFNQVYFE